MVIPIPPADEGDDDYNQVIRTVSTRLREARMRTGLTQAQVGERAGLKQSHVFELERTTSNITVKTLARMADVYGVDMRDLLPEGRSAPPTSTTLALLRSLFERVSEQLAERERLDAKRAQQNADLMAELKAFANLRLTIESIAKTDAPAPPEDSNANRTKDGGEDPGH